MTNEEIIYQIRQGKKELYEELWQQNLGIIKKLANRYKSMAEFDDLVQESYFAFVDAVERYEEEKGTFVSFLIEYVKGTMLGYIAGNKAFYVPKYLLAEIRQYKAMCSQFYEEYGRVPTSMEIAAAMDISEHKAEEYKVLSDMLNVTSTDIPLSEDEGSSIASMIDSEIDIEGEYIEKESMAAVHDSLWKIIDKLPEAKRNIIIKYYLQGIPTKDIADFYGVSIQSIGAKRKAALTKLKYYAKAEPDLMEYKEMMYAKAYGNNSFFISGTSSTESIAVKLTEREEEKKRRKMQKVFNNYLKRKGLK